LGLDRRYHIAGFDHFKNLPNRESATRTKDLKILFGVEHHRHGAQDLVPNASFWFMEQHVIEMGGLFFA
jgi:hypothetical protein